MNRSFKKVRGKILLILLLLLAVIILSFALSLGRLFETVFTSQRLDDLRLDAERYAQMITPDGDVSRLRELPFPRGQSLLVVDVEGNLIFAGGRTLSEGILEELLGKVRVFSGNPVTFKLTTPPVTDPLFVTGVPVDTNPRGALFLTEPAMNGDQMIHRVNQVLVLAVIGAFLLAGGAALFLSDRMARPLVDMERIATEMMKGDFSQKVTVRGRDELSSLGRALNRLSEHLHHVETSRAEFLSNVSHEMRTPLSYIQGYTQIVEEGLVTSDAQRQSYLRIIREEVNRLQVLLQDLLDLGRFQELQLKLDIEEVDLAPVLQKVLAALQPFAEQKQICFSYDGPSTLPKISGDPVRLQQVMVNLLHNAVQYAEEPGRVQVHAHFSSTQVLISVEDEGTGIPEQEQSLIWERFYRLEKSRNRDLGGTGIGLSIVKQIVEAHHGQIHLESALGKGTTISILIPRTASEEERGRLS